MSTKITPGPEGGLAVLADLHKATQDVTSVGKDGAIQIKNAPVIEVRTAEAVLNAIGPVFREHHLFVLTETLSVEHETIVQKNANGYERTIYRALVRLAVTVVSARDGSTVTGTVMGEAMNSGDKGTTAAHTVALRTALTHMFTLPTGEPEPDLQVYGAEHMDQSMRPVANAAPMTAAEMLQRAESDSCSAETILAMMNQAKSNQDRELYTKLDEIGSRRFPSRRNQ